MVLRRLTRYQVGGTDSDNTQIPQAPEISGVEECPSVLELAKLVVCEASDPDIQKYFHGRDVARISLYGYRVVKCQERDEEERLKDLLVLWDAKAGVRVSSSNRKSVITSVSKLLQTRTRNRQAHNSARRSVLEDANNGQKGRVPLSHQIEPTSKDDSAFRVGLYLFDFTKRT